MLATCVVVEMCERALSLFFIKNTFSLWHNILCVCVLFCHENNYEEVRKEISKVKVPKVWCIINQLRPNDVGRRNIFLL